MVRTDINIIGFSSNASLSEMGVSCTNALLNPYLMQSGIVSKIYNVQLSTFQKYSNLLLNIAFDKTQWLFKDRISTRKAFLKNSNLKKQIQSTGIGNANICLQIGSDFNLADINELQQLPKFSYHDNNILAFLKSKHGLPIAKFSKEISDIVEFEREVYRNLTGIFTMTEFLRNSFIKDFGIPENKVHCIGVGSNLSFVKNFNKRYCKDKILFVAKDSFKEKGGYDVLNAFKLVKKEIPNVKLIIVGQVIESNDKDVICTGFIDKKSQNGESELLNYYKTSGVFVMPSYVEATGNVFFEAMSCKLPCIGANVSAMPEIIIGNNSGFVVEPGDVSDLAKKICITLNNHELQQNFGENGYNAILNKYNWNVVCKKAKNIMGKALH